MYSSMHPQVKTLVLLFILSIFTVYPIIFFGNYFLSNKIVIEPDFTASAYHKDGFYNYYRNHTQCCTTVNINVDDSDLVVKMSDTYNAKLLLMLLGFKHTTDSEVCSNPDILTNKTIIVLHNEYVCQMEYDKLNNSTNVIYMYPNANYALVKYEPNYCPVDCLLYHYQAITLIRGHGYPDTNIRNGFNWTLDNSNYELKDGKRFYCTNQHFEKIRNGYQLNCWTQDQLQILSYIKEINKLGN